MTPPHFLHPFARPAASDFISIVSGEGATVRDDQGRSYVDALAGLWYCNVGHGRAEIVGAVTAQMKQLAGFHTFDIFSNPAADEVSELIAGIAPFPNARVFLTSSGSEAVDSAIKIARLTHMLDGRSERRVVISRTPSYHGVTYGALAATGLPRNHFGFGEMLADVVPVPHADLDAVERVLTERPGEVAAVIAEPVIGGGGVRPPLPGYLQGLRRLCDDHGALLILDEVICGFGRLGAWWGAEHYGVRPDMMTFAKGATSGYLPLGGVVMGTKVRQVLEADDSFVLRHGHTYSGHPAACAAAIASISLLRDDALLEQASKIGKRLAAALHDFADEGLVAETRGVGAIWAVELHPNADGKKVRDSMLERGVIVRALDNVIALCPPFVISDSELDHCVEALAECIPKDGAA
ncbi:MAG: aminotransferase class III-fold pyridoxal phosphate-dependent enzyme [Actinobacteria bacterium]|nr:aminotransferase class III-fold pyridoxal phosphate-dependent enzyme [Actinomycetota bacterium]